MTRFDARTECPPKPEDIGRRRDDRLTRASPMRRRDMELAMTDRDCGVAPKDEDVRGIEGRARSALVAMETHRLVLEEALEAVKNGEAALDPKSTLASQKELASALAKAVEAEGKADDARRKNDRGGGLDLDAARDEVERRLDRLGRDSAA